MGGAASSVVDAGLGLPAAGDLEEISFSLDLLRDPDVLFVDLRDYASFAESHLRTALHLDAQDFRSSVGHVRHLEALLAKSGIGDVLRLYAEREAKLLVVFYSQRGAWKDQQIYEAVRRERQRFSSGGARIRVAVLQVRPDGWLCGMGGMGGEEGRGCGGLVVPGMDLPGIGAAAEGFESLSNKRSLCVSTTAYRAGAGRSLLNVDSHLVALEEGKLYVGDECCARDEERMQQLGVGMRVAILREGEEAAGVDGPAAAYTLPAADDIMLLATTIPTIREFIEAEMQQGHAVLLYCTTGRTLSVVAAMAFLMLSNKWTFKEAYVFLFAKMPWLGLDLPYARALLELEYEIFQCHQCSLPLRVYALFVLCYEDALEALQFVRLPDVRKPLEEPHL